MPKWSESSLVGCLHRLATAENLPVAAKFCLFIDGLDEYAGHVDGEAKDYRDMCQTLSDLTATGRIKICVSSRPSNVFREHFGGDQSRVLEVQELTARDIKRYARDRLQGLDWGGFAGGDCKATPISLLDSFVDQIQLQ